MPGMSMRGVLRCGCHSCHITSRSLGACGFPKGPSLGISLGYPASGLLSYSNTEWREWKWPHSKAEGALVLRDNTPKSLTRDGVREASVVQRVEEETFP